MFLKGRSAGNHGFSHKVWFSPVIFALNQSIDEYIIHPFLQTLLDFP
jgi:hypothetical protein